MRDPIPTFYADVPEPLASVAADYLQPHSLLSFNTALKSVHWGDEAYDAPTTGAGRRVNEGVGRRVYLRASKDQAMPPSAQDKFVEDSGVEWKVIELGTSHSPMLSQPERLAGVIGECVGDMVGTYGVE